MTHLFRLPEQKGVLPLIPASAPIKPGQAGIEQRLQIAELVAYTSRLTPRQEKILSLYWGLSDDRPHTVQEIAEIYQVEPERIQRQLEYAYCNFHLRHRRGYNAFFANND